MPSVEEKEEWVLLSAYKDRNVLIHNKKRGRKISNPGCWKLVAIEKGANK